MKNNKGKEVIVQNGKTLTKFDAVVEIAEKLHQSGLFTHLKNSGQAVAVVEYGRELGVPPMQSLQMMAVIKGKIAMQSQLMLALVKRQGCDVVIKIQTAEKCIIDFQRDGVSHEVMFTFQEAKNLQLTYKDNWKNQPANMNFWRVVSKAIRYYAADLILAPYSIEEATEGEHLTVEDLKEQDDRQQTEVVEESEETPTAGDIIKGGTKPEEEKPKKETKKTSPPKNKLKPPIAPKKTEKLKDNPECKKFAKLYIKVYCKDKRIDISKITTNEKEVITNMGIKRFKRSSKKAIEAFYSEAEEMLGKDSK